LGSELFIVQFFHGELDEAPWPLPLFYREHAPDMPRWMPSMECRRGESERSSGGHASDIFIP
jgi:hypothetical protein